MTIPTAGGLGLGTSTGDGPIIPVEFFPGLLEEAAATAWRDGRPGLERDLTVQLGRGDLIARGFTLYDISVSLATDLSYAVGRDGRGRVAVTVTTGGNRIVATSTQPTDLGAWADPRVSIAFALTFTFSLDIPTTTSAVTATEFTDVRILNPVIGSENLVADIAFFLNDVLAFFTGADHIARLQERIAAMQFAGRLNPALGPLNQRLSDLSAQGFWFLDALVDQLDGASGTLRAQSFGGAPADRLELLLVARAFDRSGVIEGELHWPASSGGPVLKGLVKERVDATSAVASAMVSATAAPPLISADVLSTSATLLAEARATREASGMDVSGLRLVEAAAALPPTPPRAAEPLASALAALPDDARTAAVADLRVGSASAFRTLVGETVAAQVLREFATGRSDFVVSATTEIPQEGLLLPRTEAAGRMSALFAADDAQTGRRKYRLVDVVTDAPIRVAAVLAPTHEWIGETDRTVGLPDGWSGVVTVQKGSDSLDDLVGTLANARSLGTTTLAGAIDAATRAGAGVGVGPGDEVSLNPQPLPPEPPDQTSIAARAVALQADFGAVADALAAARGEDRFVVGAKEGTMAAGRGIGIAAARIRDNPTGRGAVTGIDFTIEEDVTPVVR